MLTSLAAQGRSWSHFIGDEPTYLIAAQSLAFDRDFRFEAEDYERFVERTGHPPEGLILQSPDHGETLVYGKPVFYPLFIAPFVGLAGQRGIFLANALLLAGACLLAAGTLRKRVGVFAPLWIAAFVFGSLVFPHVFWIHADLFYLSLVAAGLALTFVDREEVLEPDPTVDGSEVRRSQVSWHARLGLLLLALVAFARPVYAPVLVPAALFHLARNRSLRRLFLPAALVLAAVLAFNLLVRENWTGYSGERQGFYSYTGFPKIDEGVDWEKRVEARGPNSWTGAGLLPFPFDSRQFVWNGVYFLFGRHVGVLPYFLPLLLGVVFYRPGEARTTLLLALLVTVVAFLVLRPFNFWGGGGALGNRYFLPVYPLFWFLLAPLPGQRSPSGRTTASGTFSPVSPRTIAPPVVALLGAVPFLWPVLQEPATTLRVEDGPDAGRYAWVSPLGRSLLPYETTQSHLKPARREDFTHGDLWVKPLLPGPEPIVAASGDQRILWPDTGRDLELLIGTNLPLRGLELTLWTDGDVAPEDLVVPGSRDLQIELVERDERSVLSASWRPGRARAKHPMWWTREDVYLSDVVLRLRTLPDRGPAEQPAELRLERIWPGEAQP